MKNQHLKIIILSMIIVASIACKKEKVPSKCYISSIKTNTDSIIFTYNEQNKVSYIKSNSGDINVDMYFMDDGIYHNQKVNTNYASLPNYTINYKLNAKGFIESFQHTAFRAPNYYQNTASNVYDEEGHLVWSKMITLKDGEPYTVYRDSMVYRNGNLMEYYNFYGSSLFRKITISYTDTENTIGNYTRNDFSATDIVGFSRYYEQEHPYTTHLLGKGSKNLPSSAVMTLFFSSSDDINFSYHYTFDSQQRITSETTTRSPDDMGYPKINRFYYNCK